MLLLIAINLPRGDVFNTNSYYSICHIEYLSE